MDSFPLAEIKNHFSEYIERVAGQRDRVGVTRNGRAAAVLISPDDLESLEETLAILGNVREVKALREGLADLEAGRVMTLEGLKEELGSS